MDGALVFSMNARASTSLSQKDSIDQRVGDQFHRGDNAVSPLLGEFNSQRDGTMPDNGKAKIKQTPVPILKSQLYFYNGASFGVNKILIK